MREIIYRRRANSGRSYSPDRYYWNWPYKVIDGTGKHYQELLTDKFILETLAYTQRWFIYRK
jgi:hypothetical protein